MADPKRNAQFQFTLRTLCVFVAILAVALSLWAVFLRPAVEHGRLLRRVESCLDALARKRPADVTPADWDYLVGWTYNAKANCLSVHQFIKDHARFRRFVEELEERLEGDVSIETIDWIWDEVEAVSNVDYGRFRPTPPPVR